MDVRSPLFQNIALIVAGVLFLNPIVATAAQLAVDQAAGGNTAVTQAQNGVPMVNIATPNGSGLSHNKFTDYNVGQQGLILNNNAQNLVQTQLGGYVVGNPNLKNGAAGLILNEVTGGNASQLKGYTEVAGRSAAVIVANPHGITCDGCGFINTPRVTLSTGTPIIENGRLQRFDVDGGQISIEGQGLNAGNVDQFDLITRSAQINAELHAKKLNIITGRNEVDATTLAATAKADDGSNKPMLAIDSSALGGMYAGAIRLVGTEQGVGVKLAGDMAASAGDIQIDASGKLSLNRVAASGDVALKANTIDLNADAYAGRNATIEAQQVEVRESLAAGQRLTVQAEQLNNAGIIEAGVRANGSVNSAGHLQLDGGKVRNTGEMTSHGSMATDLQTLDNAGGTIATAGSATLKAEQLDNREGEIVAQGNLIFGTANLDNRAGSTLAGQALAIEAEAVDNRAGTLAAGGAIEARVTNALNNDGGLVEAGGRLDVEADSLSNTDGRLRALGSGGESRFAIGTRLNNDEGVLEVGSAVLSFDTESLSNQGGVVRHLGSGGLGLDMQLLGQAGGEFITNSAVSLSAEEWVNRSLLQAASIELDVQRLTQTATGGLLSVAGLAVQADSWTNDGRIETDGDLSLILSGNYRGNGTLISKGHLELEADNIELGDQARLQSGGSARLAVLGELVSRGKMTAGAWLEIASKSLENRGTIGAGGELLLVSESVRNENGLIFSGDDLLLRVDRLTNRFANIYSMGQLSLTGSESSRAQLLENISAEIESVQDMSLNAAALINRRDAFSVSERLVSGDIRYQCLDCKGRHYDLYYYVTENLERVVTSDSAASVITAGGNLNYVGVSFDNQQSVLSAAGNIDINVDTFISQGASQERVVRTRTFRNPNDSERSNVFYGLVREGGEVFNYNKYNSLYVHRYFDDSDRDGYVYYYSPAQQVTNRSNPNFNPAAGYGVPSRILGYTLVSSNEQSTNIGVAADAVIQAGGNVRVNAGSRLENGVTRENVTFADGQQQFVETGVGHNVNQPITFNSQLPPDLAQRAVDPIGLPSFSLPSGQNGLFSLNANIHHPYLIETNPSFADLGKFLSSDYMFGLLGIGTDQMQKRLGDGFYEQKLVRDAVISRTGQRFLAGINSDEEQFRYLMDNAIVSKESLNLSVGVALSAEQVAALTHDIVWLEEREVAGQKVLVPVLYLAQASGRLAPTGALIQGQDVALITGGQLTNQGTLRAQDLNLDAGNVSNSGLLEAAEALRIMATESIRNAQGGIIAGRDISAIALSGDVLNERTVSTNTGRWGGQQWQHDYVDSAARFEAANELEIIAGRDVLNRGGVLSSAGDMALVAGRDVELSSVKTVQRQTRGSHYQDERITLHGSENRVGGDLSISADRDLSVIASRISSGGSLDMQAGSDLLISSAANESHFFSRSKKVTQSRDQVTQQSSEIQAGNDISLAAGKNLTVVASKVQAGNDVDIDAGEDVQILSAMDESASYYFKKKKGSFGRSSSKQQESYHSTNIASVIEAGNDLTINTSKTEGGGLSIDGGRDVTVIGSQLSAGNDLLVGATGDVAILSGVEEHGSYSKKTKSGFLGMSKSGKSQLKTSATQVASELDAGNDVVIAAGNDIRLRASETTAGNDVELRAGLVKDTGDINLVSANDEAYSRSESYKKKIGLSVSDAAGLAVGTPSWGGDIAISSAKKSGQEIIRSTNVGSQVSAVRDASLIAERDINVVGSGVSAGRNVLLDAGRDVNVVAGSSSEQVTSWKNTKTVGLQQDFDRNGFSTFVGEEKLKDKLISSQQTAAGSQINAGLDIDVRAGRDIVQQGSDLAAGYDLNLQAGRNILIDAAAEQSLSVREQTQKRTGTTTTVNHNFGNTMDALSGAGKGDNSVSQASSILKAADGVTQFLSGPTFDAHIGSTGQSQRVTQVVQGNRASTLTAGNDVNLQAQNDVTVRGGQFSAGRDINVAGQDVVFDVARGEQRFDHQQSQSKGGIVGGTTGGFKVGIGGSSGTATQEGSQGTSSGAQLNAQRDVNLSAERDLSLIGTQVQAGRDIDLYAGNDLAVGAAANAHANEDRRRSGGGEVGLTFGSDGIGVYASVNIGRGSLDREGARQQEAYLYAGRNLNFESGRDTTVAGAKLEGENVTGEVGRNLTVSSVPDTGKVSGKEFDLSATVTIGYGASVSGSVGYGQTTGKTNWVGNQTSITARDRLDIRTEEHTQIDGAVLASQSGNLKLDTDTLGFRDIKGEDKERSYYLNAGGSYGTGQQDQSQQGKGEAGVNGWSLSGYEYEKEREQIVRATVGAGEIVVRSDAETGKDSTAGLNRDTSKAYEITKDKEERTDLYVTKSSVEAVANPSETLEQWKKALSETVSGEGLKRDLDKAKAFIDKTVEVAGHIAASIRAQQVGMGAVPAVLTKHLDDEKALLITKNFVRRGLDPKLLEKLEDKDLQALNAIAGHFEAYGERVTACGSSGGCTSALSGNNNGTQIYTYVKDGQLLFEKVGSADVLAPGEILLFKVAAFYTYIAQLPLEQAALMRVAAQALTAPVQSGVGIAGSMMATALWGEQIAAAKQDISLTVAGSLVDKDKEVLKASDEYLRELYAKGAVNREGKLINERNVYVLGAEGLVDLALDGVGSAVGRAVSGIWSSVDRINVNSGRPKGNPETIDAGRAPDHSLGQSSATSGAKTTGSAGAEVPVVRVNTGNAVKGSPEFDVLNNPGARAANTRYELDNGNSFKTNSAGQVEELTFTPVNTKVPRDARQTKAGKQGRDTDVGGHAQACSQGGTCDGYNLFPQDSNFNNSAYKVFYEKEIKRALNDPAKTVGPTTIKFNRSVPDSPRPDTLSVTYTIDGKTRTRIFENEANKIPKDQ